VPAPLLRATFSTSQLRRYANQEGVSPSVVSAFTTPFSQFLQILSRISRILLFAALGIASVGGAAYEATHQYVEHRAMPRCAVPATGDDASGWTAEMRDESWGPTAGTDPRLGFSGRHALRAAWIALNWGGGIAPELFFGGSRAPGQLGTAAGDALSLEGMPSSDGLLMCEGTLQAALDAAEKRGIRLPDIAAQRALAAPGSQLPSAAIDETALALETRLASVRERIGTPTALAGALAGYTRIYDALASQSSASQEQKARLVRLAGRLGSVSAALGQRAEAERWLLSSLHLAGAPALLADTEDAQAASNVQGALKIDAPRASSVPSASTSAAAPTEASPALTRALVASLISLSALYATAPPGSTGDDSGRVTLSTALRVQISALRLLRADAARSALVTTPNSNAAAASANASADGARLHALWLAQHDAVLGLHVAETLWALGAASPSSGIASALRSLWGGKEKVDVKQSLAWLEEAERNAESVASGLGSTAPVEKKKGKKPQQTKTVLAEKWRGETQLQVPAARLLRDAKRVVATVEELKLALAR
jgi:hypothetical protein